MTARHFPKFAGLMLGAILAGAVLMAAPAGQPPAVSRTTNDYVYSQEQARRGYHLYVATCTDCHGEDLRGIDAPALGGAAFFKVWIGRPLSELMDRIQQTMPPSAPGSLDRKQAADILAYILQIDRFPPGEADLRDAAEILRTIVIAK